jgi:hypothetical protein
MRVAPASIFRRGLPIGLLILALATGPSLARDYSLWGGQATFSLPKGGAVRPESKKEFFVYPKGNNPKRTKAFAVVTRFQLTRGEQAASLRELVAARRKNFEKDGVRVTNVRVDDKRGRASMDLADTIAKSDSVPLDFKGRQTAVRGRYVAHRVGAQVINAIAVSERRTWNSKTSKAYRRVADSLRVRR